PWRRHLEPRRQSLLPVRPRDPGRPRVDQLLSRLSGACGVRRLQAIGRWPRKPQDDARSLSADQEHAGQLQPEEARLLLIGRRRWGASSPRRRTPIEDSMADKVTATPEALQLLAEIVSDHGPVL